MNAKMKVRTTVSRRGPLLDRIEEKVERIPFSGCWVFMGRLDNGGYGCFKALGEAKAHRVSYRFFNKTIHNGLFVLHKCDVRSCINPAHLFLGTQADNIRDAVNKGRFVRKVRTHCQKGHEMTPENTYTFGGHRRCAECYLLNHRPYERARYHRRKAERKSEMSRGES